MTYNSGRKKLQQTLTAVSQIEHMGTDGASIGPVLEWRQFCTEGSSLHHFGIKQM